MCVPMFTLSLCLSVFMAPNILVLLLCCAARSPRSVVVIIIIIIIRECLRVATSATRHIRDARARARVLAPACTWPPLAGWLADWAGVCITIIYATTHNNNVAATQPRNDDARSCETERIIIVHTFPAHVRRHPPQPPNIRARRTTTREARRRQLCGVSTTTTKWGGRNDESTSTRTRAIIIIIRDSHACGKLIISFIIKWTASRANRDEDDNDDETK